MTLGCWTVVLSPAAAALSALTARLLPMMAIQTVMRLHAVGVGTGSTGRDAPAQ